MSAAPFAPETVAAMVKRLGARRIDCLQASTPILCWQAFPSAGGAPIWQGGSAFLIQTPSRLLGVTARHVYDAYVARKRTSSQISARLGGFTFDLEDRLIARGQRPRVDIATFHIDTSELPSIGFRPIEDAWPPLAPANGASVLFLGWPGHEREVVSQDLVRGGGYAGFADAQLSEDYIGIRVDHSTNLISPLPNVPLPPPNFEVGGISGGPMMTMDFTQWPITWRLGGVLCEGNPDYDQIFAARADVIQDDGRIVR